MMYIRIYMMYICTCIPYDKTVGLIIALLYTIEFLKEVKSGREGVSIRERERESRWE